VVKFLEQAEQKEEDDPNAATINLNKRAKIVYKFEKKLQQFEANEMSSLHSDDFDVSHLEQSYLLSEKIEEVKRDGNNEN
jgi:hypothetical protein